MVILQTFVLIGELAAQAAIQGEDMKVAIAIIVGRDSLKSQLIEHYIQFHDIYYET